jgi:hypothetical protein
MVIPDLIFSIFLALVISVIFTWIIRRKGPRKGFFWFFLAIFLAIFTAGIWGKPAGAPLTGLNLVPFLLAGVLVALLLTALAPKFPKVDRGTQMDREKTMEMLEEIERKKNAAALAYISLNLIFWFFIALLGFAIIVRYLP